MRNFWSLLKVNIIHTFKLNKLFKRKENRISLFMTLFVILGYIGIGVISFFYIYILGNVLNESGSPHLILVSGITFGFILIILMTITTANSYLFRSRDFDLLMSLPVSSSTVITSKIVYLLVINYFMFLLIYVPTIVVYQIYNQTSVMFWLLTLPTFLLTPLLPITISGLLSYLFGFIPLKQKHKTILTILISMAFFFLIFWSQYQMSLMEDPESFFDKLGNTLSKINLPGYLAALGMMGDVLNYLLFITISIIPFVVFIILIANNYLKSNSRSRRSEVNKRYVLTDSVSQSQTRALIVKELRRYFNSAIYVINTIITPVLSVVLLIFLILSKDRIMEVFAVLGFDIFPFILLFILAFSLSLTSTTCSSISIEGKQFWILKSLPCKTHQIFWGKIFVNLLITVPILIIDIIIALIVFNITVVDVLFLLIIPLAVLIYNSCIGLYVNLLLPRFDYDNDTKVVKQSLSVIVSMLFGILGVIILAFLGYITYVMFNTKLSVYLIVSLGGILLALISFMLLHIHGTKLYKKIHF